MNCPRCGSHKVVQWKNVGLIGLGLMLMGIGLAFFTCGLGLILSIIGACMGQKMARCKACKWRWKV